MAEYGMTLNTLISEHNKTELQCLYVEAKKKEMERLKISVKAMRAGIVEALTGKDVITMDDEVADKEDENEALDTLAEAGFTIG